MLAALHRYEKVLRLVSCMSVGDMLDSRGVLKERRGLELPKRPG
jgi:hypothetical protein